METTIFLIFICLLACGTIFALFRNEYVYKARTRHNKRVSNKMQELINDDYTKYSKKLQTDCFESVWNYNKMFCRFWVWGIANMVENRDLFDFVYDEKRE